MDVFGAFSDLSFFPFFGFFVQWERRRDISFFLEVFKTLFSRHPKKPRRRKDAEEEEEESDGNDDDDDETIVVVGKVRQNFVSSASSVATESAEEDAIARHHFASP